MQERPSFRLSLELSLLSHSANGIKCGVDSEGDGEQFALPRHRGAHQMPSTFAAIMSAVGLSVFCSCAFGEGRTIQTPGQLPTYVNPAPGGGSTIQTPGQLPTNVRRMPGGVS